MLRKFLLTMLIITVLITFISCSAIPPREEGLWKSKGYGYILEIKGNNYNLYDYTNKSLLLNFNGKTEDIKLYRGGGFFGTFENNKFITGSKEYEFEKLKQLPSVEINTFSKDPKIVFEVFWNNIEENCSLFDLKNIDMPNIYSDYREKVSKVNNETELFDILSEIIYRFNDAHMNIFAPSLDKDACSKNPSTAETVIIKNQKNYLQGIQNRIDGYERAKNTAANGKIAFGTIENKYGYLCINGLQGFTENGLISEEEKIFTSHIDSIFSYFKNKQIKGLIIDLRINSGGLDELSIILGNHLFKERTKVYSKKYRIGNYNDYSNLRDFYCTPAINAITGIPVRILTSGITVSAAEVAVLILKNIPDSKIIGETTTGSFSDMLTKILPNGWILTLSNERYISSDGKDYEQKGISPDTEILIREEDVLKSDDLIIKNAISSFN